MSEQDAQSPLFAALARGAERRIDTQGAVVFLKGDEAIKIRRAIKLPFLDYSTLEKRRQAAETEIAINRPHAPHIYKDAAPIRRTRDGFGFEGEGEIVDWATRMRRFDADATLDKLAQRGALSKETVGKLAVAIRALHARAERKAAEPAIAAMRSWIAQNADSFAERPDLFAPQAARALTQASRAALARAEPLIAERGRLGFVRRCHGDLHLGNVVDLDGEPTPFDAIEFDDTIATGDVLYDLAFAIMDLSERDLGGHANLLLNAYLAGEPPESFDALGALPLYLSLRAAIRAKVEANGAAHATPEKRSEMQTSARRYFEFACRFIAPAPSRLLAIGGLSGSGKSALGAALSPEIGMAPGAILLRSDVERKAMFGVAETTRLDDAAYDEAANARVYQRLAEKARRVVRAGAAALIDATFSRARERAECAALAAELGVPFVGLWLDAPPATRLARIRDRRGDASDADETIARRQRAEPLQEPGWRPLEAAGDLAATLSAARVALRSGAGI